MRRDEIDRLRVPLVLSFLIMAVAASIVIIRPPVQTQARARVLGVQLTPPPATPAPTPEIVPTPVPSEAPRIVAQRPAAARTSGSPVSAPRSTGGWIRIPSIGASGPVVAVGLDGNGNMVTPRNARDVAWLDNGTFPGPTRNAIMAGHRNWSGRSGTFINLENASAGDVIQVGIDGRTYTFAMSWVRMYDPANAPVEELMGPTDVDSITLVTCGGSFNRKTGHYDMRVVARAELVSVG